MWRSPTVEALKGNQLPPPPPPPPPTTSVDNSCHNLKLLVAKELIYAVATSGATRQVVAASASALFRMVLGGAGEVDNVESFSEVLSVAKWKLGEDAGVAGLCKELKGRGAADLAKQVSGLHKVRNNQAHKGSHIAKRVESVLSGNFVVDGTSTLAGTGVVQSPWETPSQGSRESDGSNSSGKEESVGDSDVLARVKQLERKVLLLEQNAVAETEPDALQKWFAADHVVSKTRKAWADCDVDEEDSREAKDSFVRDAIAADEAGDNADSLVFIGGACEPWVGGDERIPTQPQQDERGIDDGDTIVGYVGNSVGTPCVEEFCCADFGDSCFGDNSSVSGGDVHIKGEPSEGGHENIPSQHSGADFGGSSKHSSGSTIDNDSNGGVEDLKITFYDDAEQLALALAEFQGVADSAIRIGELDSIVKDVSDRIAVARVLQSHGEYPCGYYLDRDGAPRAIRSKSVHNM